ncbi:glycosyltransferase [Marinimicrococcus flavescens]|uniref:Glycosyltransferase n=1 Tax=Marinimicrococcus flavescens TaxID=3031815 RepID=A0AAP3XT56_9PROT|nr:glycosyltransferase [Marinimicrococcus flavescens]
MHAVKPLVEISLPIMPPERTASAKRPLIVHLLPDLAPCDLTHGLVDLTRHLRGEGFEVMVASAGGPLARDLAGAGASHQTLRAAGGGLLGSWLGVRRLATALERPGSTVVHVHRRASVVLGGKAAKRAGAAMLTTIEQPEELAGEDGALLLAGDRAVVPSDYVAEQVLSRPDVEPDRVVVVPPGIDLGEFDPDRVRGAQVAALAERWNVGADRRVILLPAPLTPGMGHLALLRAVARLRRRDLVLMCLGPARGGDGLLRSLEAEIRANGIGDLIRFAEGEADLAAACQLADVVALPADRPLPTARAIVAAQAMGKPVVVSNLGALPELMLPAATGWIVPPENAVELAWALERALLLEDEVRVRIAQRARAFVAAELSGETSWRRMTRIYRDLLPGD